LKPGETVFPPLSSLPHSRCATAQTSPPHFTCFLVKVSFTVYASGLSLVVAFFRSRKKINTMRLSRFILLSEEEKKQAVLSHGALLARCRQNQFTVFLFQVSDFYVETVCNPQTKTVEEYRVFGDTGLLQPYLQAISLEGLLKED
jgi:hypothetical protein